MLSRRAFVGSSSLALATPLLNPRAPAGQGPDFDLGAQTHFSHGWLLPWMDRARSLGARTLRDGLAWSTVETRPGRFAFDPYRVDFLDKARRDGVRLLLCIDPRHPGYDNGDTAFSPAAQQAFAAFLRALLDRYGDVITAVEVGNEINGERGMTGEAARHRPEAHVGLLTAIQRQVKPAHAHVAILGGSTNVIGVGFLERIFAAGGLEVMDGVAVHPYRSFAETVDVELTLLNDAMNRHGRPVPVYATEFGDQFDRPEDAPDLMLKMTAMLGASGVSRAFWYALSDEAHFRNMGLFTQRQALKPAGETFAWLQRRLLAGGRPERIVTDDLSHAYRFGRAGVVLWGVSRPLKISGQMGAFDSRGRPIALPDLLAETPVVLLGDVEVEMGPAATVADSFHQFSKAPWSYMAQTPDGQVHPLGWMRWDWTSYIGDRRFRPLAFNALTLAPAGAGDRGTKAILRYTAKAAGRFTYSAAVTHAGTGDGVDVAIAINERITEPAAVVKRDWSFERTLDVQAGDAIDLRIGPNATSGGDNVRYRAVVRSLTA